MFWIFGGLKNNMNASKFIVTVLGTALYTSSWWWIGITDKPMWDASPNMSVISFIVSIFGSGGLIVGAALWIGKNWNNK